MITSPSRYAHLPTKEEDYKYIIYKLEDGMLVEDVDDIIAELKGKKKVKYHYRTNLKNLGLFTYNDLERRTIKLDDNVYLFKKNIISLQRLLKIIIEDNEEIMYIKYLVQESGIVDFQLDGMAQILNKQFPDKKYSSILRWFRPVSFLLRYVYLDDVIISNDLYIQLLKEIQNEYFNIASDYGEPVAIEEIERQVINKYPNINDFWNKIYFDENLEYKLSFITLPSWFTSHKHLVINGKVFTHIRIKKDII